MKNFFIVILSFLIALLLQMIPLPTWTIWLRPEWVLLVLLYWALYFPERVGLNIAFLLGLIMDLIVGTLFGEHALGFVLLTYFAIRLSRRIELASVWQQVLTIFCFMLFFQTYKFAVWRWLGGEGGDWLYWVSSGVSALLWPVVYGLLNRCQKHYRVYS